MKKFTENIYILEKLGQGGMGEVFKAKIVKPEQGFEKIVALKVLPEYTPQAEKKKEALLKEARIVANLNHPNINQVFDVGETEGTPYVVMDLVEGHDLRGIIKTAKEKNIYLSTSNSIEIALSLLDALEYAHDLPSPIIHRDISPHNVMITNQGTVKLLDFGLSKIQENTDQSKTEGYVGKYSYLPLEVIEGKTYKAEHDVYALGLILYELLTLEKVYGGNLELEIIQKIKEGHIEPASAFNSKIPKELDELLIKWINPKESKRVKDILEIRRTLLVIKKELVSTSSLKEEVLNVFSNNGSFKGTVIEKRSSTQNNRILSVLKVPMISILSSAIAISALIFLFRGKEQSEKPSIEVVIENKSQSISPQKLSYAEYASIPDNQYFPEQFCQHFCDLTIHQVSTFLEMNGTESLEQAVAKLKKKPSQYYMYFLNTIYKNNLTNKLFQGCSHIQYCSDTQDLLNFFIVHPLLLKGNESFKEIAKKNLESLQKSSLYALWRTNRNLSLRTLSNFDLINSTLKESTYHNISSIAKSDFIKMPDNQFPEDTAACRTWGTTFAFHFNILNLKDLNILIFPKSSNHQILGTKNPDTLILGFPDGGYENDSMFKKGLCYIEFRGLKIDYVRFWKPYFPLSKSGK